MRTDENDYRSRMNYEIQEEIKGENIKPACSTKVTVVRTYMEFGEEQEW